MSEAVGLVVRVFLPEGWSERKFQPPGRLYHADYGNPGGFLRVTVHPPVQAPALPELDRILHSLVAGVTQDAGRRFFEHTGDSTLGRLYTAAFRNKQAGLLQVWMSSGPKGSVLATYEMGNLETVKDEMMDANAIVESADLEEFDLTGLHSAIPREY